MLSPNPVRHAALISVGFRAKGLGLSIYDAAGRLVNYFALRDTPCTIRWDGTDQNGRLVPSGAYFLETGGEVEPVRIKFTVAR
jgi:flagellar hook assembly protein FlgD